MRKQALLRALADYFLVHACMGVAIAVAVIYHGLIGELPEAVLVLRQLSTYYFDLFLLLSLLFPLTFVANGFYTVSRTYSMRHKTSVLARGVVISILLFLAANFLLFREQLVPRSVVLAFCGLSLLSIPGIRVLKRAFERTFDVRTRSLATVSGNGAVLVVGGAGYIGSVLVRELLSSGRKVRLLDSLVYGDQPLREILSHPNLELIRGDCRNIQSVVSAIKGADSIVHLAAIVGDPACDQDRQTALEINYAATRMLLEIAKGNGISRLVFASSCSVYGASDSSMEERSQVSPISLYAQTKVDSERAVLDARGPSFHPTVLRLATVFGHSPRPRFDLVVNLLAARAWRDGVITIFNGGQWRPFIHVRDVAAGIVRTLDAPLAAVSGATFNLGDNRMNYTLAQVAEAIAQTFPGISIEYRDNEDRRNYRASFNKVEKELNFTCAITLAEGITELRQVFETGAVADYSDPLYHNQRYLLAAGSPLNSSEMDIRIMAAFAGASLHS